LRLAAGVWCEVRRVRSGGTAGTRALAAGRGRRVRGAPGPFWRDAAGTWAGGLAAGGNLC